jgi:hypothetical protein
MRKFGVVLLIDTTGVYPEVLQAVFLRLVAAEPDLFVAWLVLAGSLDEVLIGDLFPVWSPCMRKDGIFWGAIPASFK